MMEPLLIGYFPGYPTKRPQWLNLPQVEEICCANRGHFPWPENWQHQNRHNALFLYDSEEIAWTVLQDEIVVILERNETMDPPWKVQIMRLPCDEFSLYAYKVWPVCFQEGKPMDSQLAVSQVTPVPEDYQKLGYDVVCWSGKLFFGCSPLFCNVDARFHPVNKYCLLDEMSPALELARHYSTGNWELGQHYCGHRETDPYWVMEIWGKSKPFRPIQRSGEPFQWPTDLLHRLVQHKLGHSGAFQR